MGSGKTTAANLLVTLLGGAWSRVAFADRLKQTVATFGGVPVSSMYTDSGKGAMCELTGRTYGQMLQDVGLMFREKFNTEVWIRACLDTSAHTGYGLIIEDVRYENELEAIHKHGGKVIKIVRTKTGTSLSSIAGRDLNHPSETTVDKMIGDYTVENDSTPKELSDKLEVALLEFGLI